MLGSQGLSEDIGEEMVNIDIVEESKQAKKVIDDIAASLRLYTNDVKMLTRKYTELLMDDNVVDIFTKISHTDIFAQQFPEFYEVNEYGECVINCQQNSSYHKYGVFKHILYTIEIVGENNKQISIKELKLLKWTMFLHDIGKPNVKTVNSNGNDSFEGHDDKSVEIAQKILDRFDFNEEEKNIILTLIKYHDRYLNDGELTFDNMSFLAQELGNRKDLFYLLIEVKIADSKAKTIDVYNRFISIVINKYYDFANTYFNNINMSKEEYLNVMDESDNLGDIIDGLNLSEVENTEILISNDSNVFIAGDANKKIEKSKFVNKKLEVEEQDEIEKFDNVEDQDFETIYKDMLKRQSIYPVYQTIVDISEKKIYGYESFNRIAYTKNVKVLDVIRKAKDFEKYDKVEQAMFINSLECFVDVKRKDSGRLFASIDVNSYQKYLNKTRIGELLDKSKVVVEIDNYDKMVLQNLQKVIVELRRAGAEILLNHFGSSAFTFDDIDLLEIDYIKYDLTLIKGFEEDEKNKKFLNELITYCIARNIKLIALGVETIEQLNMIKNMGIKYVQGFLFGKPSIEIEISNAKIEEIMKLTDDEIIA